MRDRFRNIQRCAIALASAAALLAAGCQRDAPGEAETAAPAEQDRGAQIAAEQLEALGGAANAETRVLYEGDFQASGAIDALGSGEGAWELRLLSDYAQFVRPGLGQDGGIPGERNYRERGMRVEAGPLIITLRAEACPLPSGESLPYTAHVIFEGVAYQGCAQRGVAEGAPSNWASVLPELLPAIDACLMRATERPARVTTASALDEGLVSVRIREADGGRRECIAAYDGSSVSVYESVSDLDRRAGEGDPEFQRGSAAPRTENCRSAEPALVGGEQIGWLISRTC